MSLFPMHERKLGSAFRLSSKQSDSLKMQNSLDQLLGSQSAKRIEDYTKDIEISVPQSTSTSIRCSTGTLNTPKDKITGGSKSVGNVFVKSEFSEGNLFSHILPNLSHPQVKLEFNPQNPSFQFDKGSDFYHQFFLGLTKQATKYDLPFLLEALKNGTNKQQQQVFCSKIDQLRSLEQQIATTQVSENRFGSKKPASLQNLTKDSRIREDSFPEISSFNSLDEEIEISTKSVSSLNNGSTTPARQLDLSPSPGKSDLSFRREESRTRIAPQSVQDFPGGSLQQRLEFHHLKNRGSNSGNEESSEERGTSKSMPGTYSLDDRIRKILHYKKKIIKWRVAHPPNRNFSGRSAVAGSKPRIKGKFVSKEEYQKYIEGQKKNATN